MDATQIAVHHWGALHETGTKRYEVIRLTEMASKRSVLKPSALKRSVVVTHWGKAGAKGAFKHEFFDYTPAAVAASEVKIRQKADRGYTRAVQVSSVTIDTADLRKHFTPAVRAYLASIGFPEPKSVETVSISETADLPAGLFEDKPVKPAHDYRADREWGMF